MRNIYFFVAIISFFCSVGFAQSNTVIEPELQQKLNRRGIDLIDINIVFKSQIDLLGLKAKSIVTNNINSKREIIIAELKEFAKDCQSEVLSILENESKSGRVDNISCHWITNSISCQASADVIYRLASRSDIEILGVNDEITILNNQTIDAQADADLIDSSSATPHIIQVNADDVWNLGYTGKNVVVAILDSGTNIYHYDLRDHLWIGYADTDGDGVCDDIIHGWNFATKNSEGNANVIDDYGHGTHCAGIVCGDGTIGNITGVAPDATLMSVKIVNRNGGGTPSQMIKGVEFAVENGADVLSMSLGFKTEQIGISAKESLRQTFINVLELGVVVCAAAGNDGNDIGVPDNIDIPASCPPPYIHPAQRDNSGGVSSVICVGAVDANDEYASFSSIGPVTWQDTKWGDYPLDENSFGLIRPDITAPGNFIYSLKHDENNKYKFNSGTSQATPCVAGVIALMLEKNSELTPAQICETIENTAKKLSETKNNYTGAGRVDALAAINSISAINAKPYVKVDSYSPKYISKGSDVTISAKLSNYGKGNSSPETKISLLADDPYITIIDGSKILGAIESGNSQEVDFLVNISNDTPNGHTAYMSIVTDDNSLVWKDDISIEINSSARIVYKSSLPSSIKAGENVAINVEMINDGTVATTYMSKVSLASTSSFVSIIDGEASLDAMGVNETKSCEFIVNIDSDTPDNSSVKFDIYSVPNNYNDVKNIIYEFEQKVDRYGYIDDGFDGWTTFDANEDGRNHPWWHSSSSAVHMVSEQGSTHSGKGQLMSESYCQASMIEYTIPIDNYLVSPKIRATSNSKFSFWARVHASYAYGEHFGVAISENGNNSPEYFNTIKEWRITSEDGTDWIKYDVDLSSYADKDIYVAIRHFFSQEEWEFLNNGYDAYILHVDDVSFSNVIDISDNFKYENYSYFSVTVESDPIPAPSNISAEIIDEKSILLSWDYVKYAQSYNIYRDGVFLVNISNGNSYTDSDLVADREYYYNISSVYNGTEYELSESVFARTGKADYSVAVKEVSPNSVSSGDVDLLITFINNGKFDQPSRSVVTLSCNDPYVTINSNGIGINALNVNSEISKSFSITISEDVPTSHTIHFNANITQKFEPFDSWDSPFSIVANKMSGIENEKTDEKIDIYVVGNILLIDNICGDAVINVFDLTGKVLHSITHKESYAKIDISNMSHGVYIICVNDAKGYESKKICIK